MTNYEKIKEACIKTNPEIMKYEGQCNCPVDHCQDGHFPVQNNDDGDVDWEGCPECVVNGEHQCCRPIQLADVLLAVKKINEGKVSSAIAHSWFVGHSNAILRKWNLTKTLEEQEQSTLEFIAELLTN